MNRKTLIVIGLILIAVSVWMNFIANDRDTESERWVEHIEAIAARFGTTPSAKVKKTDRTLQYIVGGLGGISLIAGIAMVQPRVK